MSILPVTCGYASGTTTQRWVIEVHGLWKSHGDKVVLDGVDLSVCAGTVTALLGPNGAGNTTAVHILSTLLRPDAGSAIVAGYDVVRDPEAAREWLATAGLIVLIAFAINWLGVAMGVGPSQSRRRATCP